MNHVPRNDREAAFSLAGTLTADPARVGRHFLQSAPVRDRRPKRVSPLRAFVVLVLSFWVPYILTTVFVV